jgi:hypothetical protein
MAEKIDFDLPVAFTPAIKQIIRLKKYPVQGIFEI